MFYKELYHIQVVIDTCLLMNIKQAVVLRCTHINTYTTQALSRNLTWCKAVSPSTFGVSISAPWRMSLRTSSLSPAAQADRKTHPSENWILRDLLLGAGGSLFVSDSSQRRSCSARLNRAELVLDSMLAIGGSDDDGTSVYSGNWPCPAWEKKSPPSLVLSCFAFV